MQSKVALPSDHGNAWNHIQCVPSVSHPVTGDLKLPSGDICQHDMLDNESKYEQITLEVPLLP